MNDFDHGAQSHRSAPLIIEQLGGKEKQRRTDSLAATGPQILANLSDGSNTRDSILPKFVLKRCQVVMQQIEDFFAVNDGWRAQ
jgi:hypothetical protein